MKYVVVLLGAALALLSSSAMAAEREFSLILAGKEAGAMSFDRKGRSEVTMTFAFNDRGRGPDVRATYQLNSEGIPIRISIGGVDYLKAPVDESLEASGGEFRWKSSVDSGSSVTAGFYNSLDGPPGELALLAQALLGAKDGRVPLLPVGEAGIAQVDSLNAGGQTLKLYEITGLSFEPAHVWLTQDNELFAMVSGWFTLIEADNAELAPQLNERQDARREGYFREISVKAATRPERPVLIDDVLIFDVAAGQVVPGKNALLVEGDAIRALLGPRDRRPKDVYRVEGKGRMLLPGLWDMHTHVDLAHGPLHLAAGITTVRDLANDHDQLEQAIAAFDSGAAPGPHIFRAGIIDGTGPFAGPTKALIDDQAEAEKWLEFYAENGYQQVKIYSSVSPELVPDMARRAHELGLRVSGHVPAGMWAEDAVRAGFDEIQHINMVFLNFYKDIVETRNPDRFIKVGERGADLDTSSGSFQAFVRLLLDNDTVVDPTVAVFMNLLAHKPGELAPALMTAEGRLPPQILRANRKGGLPVPGGWEERYQASAANMLKVIKALHDAGVPLVAGTDNIPGFTYQAELNYYGEAGIPPADILRLATLGSAEVMGVDDVVGRIAPGQRADLILVDGRPDQDIADIQNVSWVMKSGTVMDPAALYRAMSVVPVK